MSSERTPLAAVPGLSRTAALPPPPTRRPQSRVAAPASPRTAEAEYRTEAVTQAAIKRPARRPASSSATVTRNVTLSLPASLVARIRDRARQDRATQPEVLLDALSATESDLGSLLADAAPTPTTDGLFVRRTPRPAHADPLSTLSLRLLSTNLETIDSLVAKHGAASRSALCAAALRQYLHTTENTET
jgi:hypothetical protein